MQALGDAPQGLEHIETADALELAGDMAVALQGNLPIRELADALHGHVSIETAAGQDPTDHQEKPDVLDVQGLAGDVVAALRDKPPQQGNLLMQALGDAPQGLEHIETAANEDHHETPVGAVKPTLTSAVGFRAGDLHHPCAAV
jgi:hypothetical protein